MMGEGGVCKSLLLSLPSFPSQSGEDVHVGFVCLANHSKQAAERKQRAKSLMSL